MLLDALLNVVFDAPVIDAILEVVLYAVLDVVLEVELNSVLLTMLGTLCNVYGGGGLDQVKFSALS